jgi:hypothetical protein
MKILQGYTWKFTPELFWMVATFVATMVVTALFEALGNAETWTVDDWKVWGVALGISAGRAILSAILAAVTGSAFKVGDDPN